MTNKVTSVSEVITDEFGGMLNIFEIRDLFKVKKKKTFCQLATFGCAKAAAQDCKMVVKTTPICSQSIGCLQGTQCS